LFDTYSNEPFIRRPEKIGSSIDNSANALWMELGRGVVVVVAVRWLR
jgi:hypothetical protein